MVTLASLEKDQELYIIRYSKPPHPDYVKIKIVEVDHPNEIVRFLMGRILKSASAEAVNHMMFTDKHRLAKKLWDSFIKRGITHNGVYDTLFKASQLQYPELWI